MPISWENKINLKSLVPMYSSIFYLLLGEQSMFLANPTWTLDPITSLRAQIQGSPSHFCITVVPVCPIYYSSRLKIQTNQIPNPNPGLYGLPTSTTLNCPDSYPSTMTSTFLLFFSLEPTYLPFIFLLFPP